MFQIGIVIVEPPAILHHCNGIINDKSKRDCKLPVMHDVETIECVVLNYSHDSKPDDRQLNGDPGPYPALTVLQQANAMTSGTIVIWSSEMTQILRNSLSSVSQ